MSFLEEYQRYHCSGKNYSQKELFSVMLNNIQKYKKEFDGDDISTGFISVQLSFSWIKTKQGEDFWSEANYLFEKYIQKIYYQNQFEKSIRDFI